MGNNGVRYLQGRLISFNLNCFLQHSGLGVNSVADSGSRALLQ